MPMSRYLSRLRQEVGNRLLLLPAVACIIHDQEGRVLMVRTHDDDDWTLPGGMIDPGETPRQAAEREALEETGLVVKAVRLLDALGGPAFHRIYPNGHEVEAVVCVFGCDIEGGALHFDGVETTDGAWFSPSEVARRFERYPAHLFEPPGFPST